MIVERRNRIVSRPTQYVNYVKAAGAAAAAAAATVAGAKYSWPGSDTGVDRPRKRWKGTSMPAGKKTTARGGRVVMKSKRVVKGRRGKSVKKRVSALEEKVNWSRSYHNYIQHEAHPIDCTLGKSAFSSVAARS